SDSRMRLIVSSSGSRLLGLRSLTAIKISEISDSASRISYSSIKASLFWYRCGWRIFFLLRLIPSAIFLDLSSPDLHGLQSLFPFPSGLCRLSLCSGPLLGCHGQVFQRI